MKAEYQAVHQAVAERIKRVGRVLLRHALTARLSKAGDGDGGRTGDAALVGVGPVHLELPQLKRAPGEPHQVVR